MKMLVTGGAGFIGSNIVKVLLEQGYHVRVVDNLSTGTLRNIQPFLTRIEFLKGDLSNVEVAREAVDSVDFVLHQAAIPSVSRSIAHPIASNNANISATLNVLVAARDSKVNKVVYASSSSIYGDSPRLPKRESFSPNPISPYALTKYVGEKYCALFHELYGLRTLSLRYFNVFGPNQDPNSEYAAAIPRFIKAVLKGEEPIIYGDGEQSRDFTYVENVVLANILAINSEISGEVMNVACGKSFAVNQVVSLISNILKEEVRPVHQPRRPGDIRHSLADITKAKRLLHYAPVVSFEDGLRKTIKWYEDDLCAE
jgi:UDP-glucose 4-epimerase